MGRHIFSHLQYGRALSHTTVTGEDKHHISEFPSAFFPQILLLTMHHGIEHLLGQLASLVLAESHPKSLCTPSPSWICSMSNRGSLDLSAAQHELYHPCVINTVLAVNPKHSTMWAALKKISHISAKTSSLHLFIFFFFPICLVFHLTLRRRVSI